MEKPDVKALYEALIPASLRVYLGEKGVSQSEASHKADMLKERSLEPTTFLNTVKPYTQTLDHDGVKVELIKGTKCPLDNLRKNLLEDGTLYGASAWLREGVKAKDAALELIKGLPSVDFTLDESPVKKPEYPTQPKKKSDQLISVTEDDVKAEWTVAELAGFLALEAKCSHLGQKIQPRGWFHEFRNKLFNMEPVITKDYKNGVGIKTYFAYNTALYTREEIDELFNSLQEEYRSAQQQLNYKKAQLKNEANKRAQEVIAAWRKKDAEYQAEYQTAYREYAGEVHKIDQAWADTVAGLESLRIELRKYISALKIVVPEALASLINTKEQA